MKKNLARENVTPSPSLASASDAHTPLQEISRQLAESRIRLESAETVLNILLRDESEDIAARAATPVEIVPHTPLPWLNVMLHPQCILGNGQTSHQSFEISPDEYYARGNPQEAKALSVANALLIVRCVNAHADLSARAEQAERLLALMLADVPDHEFGDGDGLSDEQAAELVAWRSAYDARKEAQP